MSHFPTRRAALIAVFVALAFAGPALASPEDDALVAKAAAYLDGLTSVRAEFTQSNQRGDTAQGELYLARPGRARFQYAAPSTLLITSDGRTVIVSDSRLKSFQRFALSSTPLAVFLADHIRLDRGASVQQVERSAGGFSVTARAHGAQGEITLYFANAPIRLTGWAITDAQGHITRVIINSLAPVAPPPDDFFTQTPSDG